MTRTPVAADATPTTRRSALPRAAFGHALRSEWTKLRSLRSTYYALAALFAVGVGLTVAYSLVAADSYHSPSPSDGPLDPTDPTGTALFGLLIAQLAIMVLGILVATGEYATGMILPSLTAVPRRGRLLVAKAVATGTVVLVAGTVTGLAMFLLGQAILASQDVPHDTLGDPAVRRAVLGVGLYLTGLGLLSLAVGTIVRATAGSLATMIGFALVLPNLIGLLPESVAEPVTRYWPTVAGLQVTAPEPDPAMLGPWAGLAWMCTFVAVVLAVALALLRHRDAGG